MKSKFSNHFRGRAARISMALLLCGLIPTASLAADKTWVGNGSDAFWLTANNWNAGLAPLAGDNLFFGGGTRLGSTNNFAATTAFGSLTFKSPSGAFILAGNSMTLNGNITNNQVATLQTINTPLILSSTPTVNIVTNGVVAIGGKISGAFGVTVNGGGQLNLTFATNTFTGPLTVNNGTVGITSETSLGTAPGSPASGKIVLDSGTLRISANSFSVNTNRGIALGPTSGSSVGTLDVAAGLSINYGGVIANNGGGTGSLTKSSFGTLNLFGKNTYSGINSVTVGTLQLDFTQATSPASNIISSGSALILGGSDAGLSAPGTNFAQLKLLGANNRTNSQSFASTLLTLDPCLITLATTNTVTASNTMTLALGALNHTVGGNVTFTLATNVNGRITTTTTNVNGILGGWAAIGDGQTYSAWNFPMATNLACVDANSNIVPYTGFTVVPNGTVLHGNVTSANNLLITTNSAGTANVNGGTTKVDVDGAGTTTDVNTITRNGTNLTSYIIMIGTNNTLRLGKYGAFFLGDLRGGSMTIGSINTWSNNATLTAGGAPNTPGEIVFRPNATALSGSTTYFVNYSRIADNGSGPVSVVLNGGAIQCYSSNTYSGGTYILDGRWQVLAPTGITQSSPFGTGPIYIRSGGQILTTVNLTLASAITNAIFLSGPGDTGENFQGALRQGYYTGPLTLLGDAVLSPANLFLMGPVSGSYNFGLSGPQNAGTTVVGNTNNSWSGNTLMYAPLNQTGANNNNIIIMSNNYVIPSGLGKGDVFMLGSNTPAGKIQSVFWDLRGFNQTINGLWTQLTASDCWVSNGVAGTLSTLTLGNNDASASFGGNIVNGQGQVALTKIGQGIETLSGTNSYGGSTIVNAGTLALTGSGSLVNSTNITVNTNATLDVSGLTTSFTVTNTGFLQLTSATLVVNSTVATTPALTTVNSAITLIPNASPQITATTLTTGGTTNLINIPILTGISGYPVTFPLIQYTTLNGAGNNFGLGLVPSPVTAGYISNDTVNAQIVLVLTNGPKTLTWTGTNSVNPNNWDSSTINWLAFKGTAGQKPVAFNIADSVIFNDTGATGSISLQSALNPGSVTVSNSSLNYVFGGAGNLTGFSGITKQGSGTLTLSNSTPSDFSGGVTVSGGSVVIAADQSISGGATVAASTTLQVGINNGAGNLPSGIITDDGSLVFNRGADLTVANNIIGAGGFAKNDAASVLTLSGNNSYSGTASINAGTVKAGSSSALGQATTTVSSGATLDAGGQNLGTNSISVVGAGVGSTGAIINSGADQTNAAFIVSLTGDTTFGGTGRWDIRTQNGNLASLSTGGNAYNLTKVGANQVSLNGVSVDSALGNIVVSSGTLSIEGGTTSAGNPASTLTVSSGATLQLSALTNALDKVLVLNGNGTTSTLINGSGACSINPSVGPTTLAGNCLFNIGGASLTVNGTLTGSASMTKTGAGVLIIPASGAVSYNGSTTISNGTLFVDGTKTGGSGLLVLNGANLGGNGSISENVGVTGASVTPGDSYSGSPSYGTVAITGNLSLDTTTANFEVEPANTVGTGVNDLINITGNLNLTGVSTLSVKPGNSLDVFTKGTIYTVIQYSGTLTGTTNNLTVVSPTTGYVFALVDPATTPGSIQVKIISAIQNDTWVGGNILGPTIWDNGTTTNWSYPSGATVFTNLDFVNFDDSSLTNKVTMVGALAPSAVYFNNSINYTVTGSGSLTGTLPGSLNVSGGGKVTLANSGTNTFTSGVLISGSTLQLGDGTVTNTGVISTAPITNGIVPSPATYLVFNEGGNVTFSSVISGLYGAISNIGPGKVELKGANTFFGQVDIAPGATLVAANNTALGNDQGITVVASGGTLDLGGSLAANALTLKSTFAPETIQVSGTGVGGAGALVNNSSNSQINALQAVTMTGDTTFGGVSRWDIRATGQTAGPATATLSTGGNPYTLTKTGTNLVSLCSVLVDSALGDINLQAGALTYEGATSGLGDPAYKVTVSSNATLYFYASQVPLDKKIQINGGGGLLNLVWTNYIVGNVIFGQVAGDTVTNTMTANIMEIDGAVGGPGNMYVNGPGKLILAGINTNQGSTTIDTATLALTNTTGLGSGPLITLISNGVLDVTGRTDGTLTISSGKTLKGKGTVSGNLVASAGSTVTPGFSIGQLNVTNGSATLQGNTVMEIDKAAGTNDVLNCSGSLTLGGTLTVSNLTTSPLPGDTYKLFKASSYSGSFATVNLPALGGGLGWDQSQLNSAGLLTVTGTITPPTTSTITLSGSNLTLTGTGGVPNAGYRVFSSADLTVPRASWTQVGSGVFDSSGNFTITITVTSSTQQFYTLVVP